MHDTTHAARPELAALWIADPAARWSALGFEVAGGRLVLGGVTMHLEASGRGIARWALSGIDPAPTEIDGLATETAIAPRAPAEHPNGAVGIDHVVAITPEFDRTPGIPPGPARFYGLVVIVSDLDAIADRLGARLGPIHDAVQPGRRIATLATDAGPSPKLAFMDPEPRDRSH